MSDRSKSKRASLRAAVGENSAGFGGVVGRTVAGGGPARRGVSVAGPGAEGADAATLGVLGVAVAGGPPGAGADAPVVAGRFGHPVRRSTSDTSVTPRGTVPKR